MAHLYTEYDAGLDSVRNSFTSLGPDHGTRRRRVEKVYTKAFVQKSPALHAIQNAMVHDRLMPFLREQAEHNRNVEILDVLASYGIDFVTAFIFGLPRGVDFLRDVAARNEWLTHYRNRFPPKHLFWLQEMPDFTKTLRRIGLNPLPSSYDTSKAALETWALCLVDATAVAQSDPSKNDREKPQQPESILYTQIQNALEDESRTNGKVLSPAQRRLIVASEVLDHVGMRPWFCVG
jgi:hypothetical protein